MLIINITPSFLSKTPGRVVFSTRCVEEMKSNTAHVFLILLHVLSETTETRGREGGGRWEGNDRYFSALMNENESKMEGNNFHTYRRLHSFSYSYPSSMDWCHIHLE